MRKGLGRRFSAYAHQSDLELLPQSFYVYLIVISLAYTNYIDGGFIKIVDNSELSLVRPTNILRLHLDGILWYRIVRQRENLSDYLPVLFCIETVNKLFRNA